MIADFRHVAAAVLRRNLIHAYKNPALLVPSIAFPMVFLIAFAGGLSGLGDVPGFDFPSGYTAFQFVFVFLQSAAFGGIFTGFAIAADYESGFARRLMLASPQRTGIIAGYVVAAFARFCTTTALLTVAAVIAGMQIDGSGLDLVGMLGIGLLVNAASTLWSAGLSMRARSLQVGPLMQVPVFLILFLAPVYVPLDLLKGWIHDVASYNPATALLESGRGFISGEPTVVGLAYLCGWAMVFLLCWWAIRGLRHASREP